MTKNDLDRELGFVHEKLVRLHMFAMSEGPEFLAMSEAEQFTIRAQVDFMHGYAMCLRRRIAIHERPEPK